MVLAGDVALTIALASSLVFLVTYALTAKWWRTEFGWHLICEGVMFLGILTFLFAAAMMRSQPPDPETPRFIIYSLITVITWWRWVILVREQRPRDGGNT